jgi:hypothetical protein
LQFNYRSLFRMSLEQIDGTARRFAERIPGGRLQRSKVRRFAVAPDGDLYIGNLQDSVGGGNTGCSRMDPAASFRARLRSAPRPTV